MTAFQDIPNISKTLENHLLKAGIQNIHDLRENGSEIAILKISALESSGVCINMLYALEGAIQGIRWHNISPQRRRELLEFYHAFVQRRQMKEAGH